MAQKELVRLKSVVKLQAAIRGHLVRQRALGSLRCVQAIVKMQILIRAKHARTLGSNVEIGEDKKKASSKTSKMELSIAKPPVTYTSLQKLLSSRFARQLMESTPKSRPINIKCDPLQPNSAWTWFERWTAPSPVEPTPKPERCEKVEEEKKEEYASPVEESEGSRVIEEKKAEYDSPEEESEGFHVVEEKKDEYDSPVEESEGFHVVEVKKEEYVSSLEESECSQVVQDSKSNIKEVVSSPKREETPIAYYDASNSSFKRCHSVEDKLEQPQGDASIRFDDAKETLVCLQGQEWEQPGSPQRSIKRLATEELHNDQEKEIVHGPKKVSDPAFVATLSKFEGLNSTTDSNKASSKDTLIITKESSMTDNSVDNIASACDVESEWGPKHSTLDSPNHISEVGAAEHKEVTISDNSRTWKNVGDEESKNTLEDQFVNQPEEIIGGENEAIMVQQEQEAGSGVAVVAYKSSPEASLRSHMTINAESHGTPGSQVSVSKSEKSERRASSSNKRKSLSAGQKKLGSSPKTHSAKDEKKGKRRSSFGSPRREDEATEKQEPRPSNGNSSSLPRFMLATESARAKLQLNNSSPRSSPDASDREYIKKRHSLPGANGKEGSPQIKRTFSQAESVPKPNASLASREKKWQR
ncbi:Protein IQ-DOMAIN 32 [Linum grandiflorum]